LQNARAVEELTAISGQKPVITKAKRSISNFKLREGVPIGCRVTLRGARMYEFLDRLINVAIPRIRGLLERYDIKAIGVYLVASKNWRALGNFGGHLGISKNFWEDAQNDDDLNVFFGFDKDVTPTISLFAEYNAALDDNDYELKDISFGQGRGYLNAGLRWYISPSLRMEIDFNDILLNKDDQVNYVNRELKIIYSEYF